ncbi:MAG TPA: putative glycolipid-binding domain-containing protein [Gemmatimonadota bacterium]|nr:putative glycolipid-binding domain-containing protein [Gemmatimonadota bacterium]
MTSMILWRRLDLPGHEIGILEPRKDGWELRGTAVFSHDGRPCKLDYVVLCDPDWRTSSARVEGMIGDRGVALKVSVDGRRHWCLNGEDSPAVAGCTDIDLGFSPSTNLLPIRRLSLTVGEEAEVRAAWLPFPALEFEPLPQMYRREGERTYRYESSGGRFVRMLEVNRVGFVVKYPELWLAEATQHGDLRPR